MNQNRLVQMETTTQATAAGHPYTKLQFVYDWQGRRIARHVWQGGTQASPTFKSSHRWLYDGWNVITEFTATSVIEQLPTRVNTFTWGLDLSGTLQGAGGVGGLLVQTAVSGGVTECASYDGNGNIVAWTKSYASAPTSRREYDAFGNTLVSEGAAPSTFGFSTKMQDNETGLYYYGYRFYDPVTGRWPSRDPIEEEGGVNLYVFVMNRPQSKVNFLGNYTYNPYIAGSGHGEEGQAQGPSFQAEDLGLALDPRDLNKVKIRANELGVCGLDDGAVIESGNIEVLAVATNQMSIGHLSGVISGKYTVMKSDSKCLWRFNGKLDPEDWNQCDYSPKSHHPWWANICVCPAWARCKWGASPL